jgi:hypothetical protein
MFQLEPTNAFKLLIAELKLSLEIVYCSVAIHSLVKASVMNSLVFIVGLHLFIDLLSADSVVLCSYFTMI